MTLCTVACVRFIFLLIDTWTGGSSGSMLGTVIATAVIAAVIIITLLGVLFAMIFVIVKKLKTVHSGEVQVTNQNTTHRYSKLEQINNNIIILLLALQQISKLSYCRPANSEVEPQGLNEQVSCFY